mmetsp:Transcript_75433/g.149173  ORF Transcript_75433/g.149173 Transcript_75433/m.149173 type:complete len:238 (+) Transcript_75433:1-714(+)
MKLVSTAERQLVRQLHQEQQERNRAVTELWARLKEVDQQIQVLQVQSQERQAQALAPSPLHDPIQEPKSPLSHRDLPVAASVSENVASDVTSQVLRLEERVQALMDQISENQARFRKGSPEMSGTESFSQGPPDNSADAMVSLQGGLKDLSTKHEQMAKELSYVKGVLTEVHISMHINAIRASRIALQSTDLSRDERNQALAALDKKELECKGHIRKVCSGPHLADLMNALTTDPVS